MRLAGAKRAVNEHHRHAATARAPVDAVAVGYAPRSQIFLSCTVDQRWASGFYTRVEPLGDTPQHIGLLNVESELFHGGVKELGYWCASAHGHRCGRSSRREQKTNDRVGRQGERGERIYVSYKITNVGPPQRVVSRRIWKTLRFISAASEIIRNKCHSESALCRRAVPQRTYKEWWLSIVNGRSYGGCHPKQDP